MNNETKNARIEIRTTEEKKEKLEQLAKKNNLTVSALLESFIDKAIGMSQRAIYKKRNYARQLHIAVSDKEKEDFVNKVSKIGASQSNVIRKLFLYWLNGQKEDTFNFDIPTYIRNDNGKGRTNRIGVTLPSDTIDEIKLILDPLGVPVLYLGYTLVAAWLKDEITLDL